MQKRLDAGWYVFQSALLTHELFLPLTVSLADATRRVTLRSSGHPKARSISLGWSGVTAGANSEPPSRMLSCMHVTLSMASKRNRRYIEKCVHCAGGEKGGRIIGALRTLGNKVPEIIFSR